MRSRQRLTPLPEQFRPLDGQQAEAEAEEEAEQALCRSRAASD